MRVLVTGASGLVGRPLVAALVRRGHRVVALSRDPDRHRPAWPSGVEALRWDGRSELDGIQADAVVNVAGEPVVGRRWTPAARREMRDSRVLLTRRVVEWVNRQGRPPALVSTSAAGYYGFDARGPCPESRPSGTGFLAELAHDWEAEAAATRGRLVVLRLGHILSPQGGYLGTLLPFARLHLAGPVTGGRQPMPWVHIDDVVQAFLWAVEGRVSGTFNVVSPGAAGRTQREFSQALAQALGKRRQLPVPLWMIRLRFGNGAGPALAGGQDLRSDAIQAQGFRYGHPDLAEALDDLLRRPS